MIKISVENINNAQRLLEIAPKEVTNAALAAINRTATTVNARASRYIRERYIVKAKDIKGHIKKYQASRSNLTARIVGSGDRLLITHFKVSRNKKGPLKAQVLKAGGAKAVPGMFYGRTRRGFDGVLKRKTAARYPLDVPHGPSVPAMFGNDDVTKKLTALAEETLNKRFEHEISYRFSKILEE